MLKQKSFLVSVLVAVAFSLSACGREEKVPEPAAQSEPTPQIAAAPESPSAPPSSSSSLAPSPGDDSSTGGGEAAKRTPEKPEEK